METKTGNTAANLMKAALEGDTAAAQRLIQGGANVNARDDGERTALMIAASNGHTYIVQLLMDNGADPAARDSRGMTALRAAEAKGFARIASMLRSSTTNSSDSGAQQAAASAANLANVAKHDDLAAALQKSLQQAADKGDANLLLAAIAKGADPNARTENHWTPLMLATIKGHTEIVRQLLDKGANVNAQNNKGWTALMFAVSMGDADTMRVLLKAKRIDANLTDAEGKTALMQAASENNLDSARILLAHKVDANVADRAGETALTIAARRNYTDIIELLKQPIANNESSASDAHDSRKPESFDEAFIKTESLFNESELQRLKEELEGYLPQTWPSAAQIENQLESRAIPASQTLLMPSELSQLGERLIAALEALRQTPFPQLQSQLQPPPSPAPTVSIADIAHKIMLTLPEAAALAGLSRTHLQRAVRKGSLKAKKPGRGWRIKRADLDAYINEL
ncbi:MAG: ankyrin repeat domain-containing protein [Pyrinomonadaceae bacterium]